MKLLLLSLVSVIGFAFQSSSPAVSTHALVINTLPVITGRHADPIPLGGNEGGGRMSCAVFKSQDYCRAEVENFDFDVRFVVVSARVYFTGANFKTIGRGAITGSSLKPVKTLMQQCVPGSIVIFDEIKVKGPDNKVRTLAGVSYNLY